MVRRIVELALDKKAIDVISMDVRGRSDVTDYFVIATGAVDVHLKAVADNILDKLKDEGIKPLHIEGYDNMRWILMDFIDVVVHLFLPETRKFYSIEKLWAETATVRYEQD